MLELQCMPDTLHLLRHIFATVGVEADVPEEVMGFLLNHAKAVRMRLAHRQRFPSVKHLAPFLVWLERRVIS
jgi:hypothetical protein